MKTDPLTPTSLRLAKEMAKDDGLTITVQSCCFSLEDLIKDLRTLEWSEQHILMVIQTIAMYVLHPEMRSEDE